MRNAIERRALRIAQPDKVAMHQRGTQTQWLRSFTNNDAMPVPGDVER